MDLSFKIIATETSAIVDVGHFSFSGSESSLEFRAQIIDNDDDGRPVYLGLGSSVSLTFPNGITVGTTIEENRSLIGATLVTSQLEDMLSGDLNGTLNSSIPIVLGNCIRRTTVAESSVSVGGSDLSGKVKTNSSDGSAGFLSDEIVVAGNLTKEVIDDPTFGKVLRLTATESTQTETLTNLTGVEIGAGKAVRLVGENLIDFAGNTSLSSAKVIGVTLSAIPDGESGSVFVGGVAAVTLSGATSGDVLFLGASGGDISTSPPIASGSVIFKIGDYNADKIYLRLETIGVN